MPFEARFFQLAKDPEHPDHNQDAYAYDSERGIAAVADGVASAIFSGAWADTLVNATVLEPPDTDDADRFAHWLAECRRQWADRIDTTGLAWFQKAKLPTGAFSTLLWTQLLPLKPEHSGSFGGFRLLVRAIGDSCLFHVRHGELLRSFPVGAVGEFENNPLVLGSVDLGRDALIQFASLDVTCYRGDHLLLTTDAVAEWLYRQIESSNPPDWPTLLAIDESQWMEKVHALRAAREMRYDDATGLVLQITGATDSKQTDLPHVGEISAAEVGTPVRPLAEQPLGATVEGEHSPTKAALNQIADGVSQLADESLRAGRTMLNRLRDRFRRP